MLSSKFDPEFSLFPKNNASISYILWHAARSLKLRLVNYTNFIAGEKCDEMDDVCLTVSKSGHYILHNGGTIVLLILFIIFLLFYDAIH